MATENASPQQRHVKSPQPIRWWPALCIIATATLALAWVWFFFDTYRQDKFIKSVLIGMASFGLLLIWLLFLSRLRIAVRLGLFVGILGAVALMGTLFKIRGVTGDLVPVLEWRWTQRPLESANTPSTPLLQPKEETLSNTSMPRVGTDFPQFLGPDRDGKIARPTLQTDWSAKPPELLWRRPMGTAWSGFAIQGNNAVTQEQRGEQEMTVCYDLETGAPKWSHGETARYATTIAGEGPRATPTISSNRVYAFGATGILTCLDLATGQRIWSTNVLAHTGAPLLDWGMTSAPLIWKDKVIVSAGGRTNQSLVAYHLADGSVAWAGGSDEASFSSPVAVTLAGVEQILIFNARNLASHDPASGVVLWEYPWPAGHPHITLPLILRDNRVLISSGYGTGSALLDVSHRDNGWKVDRVWKSIRLKSKFANIIDLEGYLYGLDDGILVCIESATGDLKWKEGRYGHGQMLLVDRVLLIMAENGEVVLIDPDPSAHRLLARLSVFRDKTWNPPALAGDILLVRDDKEAACFRLPTTAASER